MGITEHIEGDECKWAAWTGRSPMVENKMILKVSGCLLQIIESESIFSLNTIAPKTNKIFDKIRP